MPKNHAIPRAATLPPEIPEAVVETFKAVADSTRAQLVFLLTHREYTVNELAERVPVSAVSHHLAKLGAIRLVCTRRDGNQIYYSIDDSHVAGLFREPLAHLEHVHHNLPDQPYPTLEERTEIHESS